MVGIYAEVVFAFPHDIGAFGDGFAGFKLQGIPVGLNDFTIDVEGCDFLWGNVSGPLPAPVFEFPDFGHEPLFWWHRGLFPTTTTFSDDAFDAALMRLDLGHLLIDFVSAVAHDLIKLVPETTIGYDGLGFPGEGKSVDN